MVGRLVGSCLVRWTHREIVVHKGKVIPLRDWTGPEGSRRLRLADFKTFDT